MLFRSALADRVLAMLGERGQKRVPVEGLQTGDWVLIDGGDVLVHLFLPDVRRYYDLERIWKPEE